MYGYLTPRKVIDANRTTKESTAIHNTDTKKAPVAEVANSATTKTLQKQAPVSNVSVLATIETSQYTMKIDNLGRISNLILKEKKYEDSDGKPLDVIAKSAIRPLEVRFKDEKLNQLAFTTDYKANVATLDASKEEKSLELTQELDGKTFKKILTFYPDGHYALKIDAPENIEYLITPGLRPFADTSRFLAVRGVILRDALGVLKKYEKGDAKEAVTINNISVVAAVDRYYTTLLFKKSGTLSVVVSPSGVAGKEKEPVAFILAKGNSQLEGYVGPKDWNLFGKIDKKLQGIIEFGWFTFLSKPFFKVMLAIHNYVGNWGWAIILFTLLVKLVLFPLSYKGLMSMQKMKDLAPKMKELKEKYGKDPAKMNQQMMQLYKKHGANPMGGCLPMILQIPIFIALYRVLLNANELQGAPWIGWISDLSRYDHYFILPIIMGATMYFQQKLSPNTMTDPTQKKIFQFLPVIFTVFFITFPAGLVLYSIVNTVVTIIQQLYINKAYEKYKQRNSAKQSK